MDGGGLPALSHLLRTLIGVESGDGSIGLSAAEFCQVARALSLAACDAGLAVPTFRSPPRTPGVDRAVRRYDAERVCVLVRRAGVPVAGVLESMVEGIVVASAVDDRTATTLRPRLMAAAWAALAKAAA
jgi:hypothetical protein